jgi:hypothetical protein
VNRRLLGLVLVPLIGVSMSACGRSGTAEPAAATGATAATTAPPAPSTTAGAPVVSLTPVPPVGVDPTAPLPGLCTQSGTGSVCPPDPEASQQFVGLSEADASVRAAQNGWAFRVAERDGEQLLLTQDYNPQRVNVAVSGGTVQRAWFG